jgi:hypothetical protein
MDDLSNRTRKVEQGNSFGKSLGFILPHEPSRIAGPNGKGSANGGKRKGESFELTGSAAGAAVRSLPADVARPLC